MNHRDIEAMKPGDVLEVSCRPFAGTTLAIFRRIHHDSAGKQWLIVSHTCIQVEVAMDPHDVVSILSTPEREGQR